MKFDKVGFSLTVAWYNMSNTVFTWTAVHFDKWPNSVFWSIALGLWSETSKFKVTQSARLFEKIPCLWRLLLNVLKRFSKSYTIYQKVYLSIYMIILENAFLKSQIFGKSVTIWLFLSFLCNERSFLTFADASLLV